MKYNSKNYSCQYIIISLLYVKARGGWAYSRLDFEFEAKAKHLKSRTGVSFYLPENPGLDGIWRFLVVV